MSHILPAQKPKFPLLLPTCHLERPDVPSPPGPETDILHPILDVPSPPSPEANVPPPVPDVPPPPPYMPPRAPIPILPPPTRFALPSRPTPVAAPPDGKFLTHLHYGPTFNAFFAHMQIRK